MKYAFSAARTSVAAGLLVCGAPLPAQTAAPVSTICKAIPFIVGNAVEGAEVAGKFSSSALKKLIKIPEISGRAGSEIVKTAYAGINSQAMSDVFDALGCRVKTFIKDTDADADKKRVAVTLAIARLNGEMAFIQSAFAAGPDAVSALRDQYLNASRSDTAPVLNSSIASEALKSIDTINLFTNVEVKKYWLGFDYSANISIQACGGVVKAAISDGGSALQRSLASTRDILINYLDPDTPLVVSLSKLMLSSVSPNFKPAPAVISTFKDCTRDLTQTAAVNSAAAASAPVAVNPPVAPASAP